MSGDEDDLAELFERILGACDRLDRRLDAAEAELTPPSPAKLSDGAGLEPGEDETLQTSAAEPVFGAQSGTEIEQALNDGWRY
jgi:hypothetical protein